MTKEKYVTEILDINSYNQIGFLGNEPENIVTVYYSDGSKKNMKVVLSTNKYYENPFTGLTEMVASLSLRDL